ncbi:odorant-binding protein 2b [Saimiri boliviensis]|uniref:odorant-binding protein 2b n=1 Tax=Saimiri boliviensis TaxID=27679 RepID=UPI003D77BA96
MKTLLLAVGLILITALEAQDLFASEEPDISGTWYIKAIAARKGILAKKVSPVTLSLLSSGNVQASFTKRSNGQCHKIDIILEKTGVPGRYRVSGALHFLHMEGSSVRDHRLFFSELQFEGERFQVAKLMGRNPDVNTEALEEFKKFAQRKGFLEDDIFIPLQTGQGTPWLFRSPRAAPPGTSVLPRDLRKCPPQPSQLPPTTTPFPVPPLLVLHKELQQSL